MPPCMGEAKRNRRGMFGFERPLVGSCKATPGAMPTVVGGGLSYCKMISI